MTNLEKRFTKAMKEIGGAAGLLDLPERVKAVLRSTTDLEAKTKMLELIVKEKRKERR